MYEGGSKYPVHLVTFSLSRTSVLKFWVVCAVEWVGDGEIPAKFTGESEIMEGQEIISMNGLNENDSAIMKNSSAEYLRNCDGK